MDGLAVANQQVAVDRLCTVTILPVARRGQGFDPSSVRVDAKYALGASAPVTIETAGYVEGRITGATRAASWCSPPAAASPTPGGLLTDSAAPDDRLSYDVTVRWPDGRTLISRSSAEPATDVVAALREVATTTERVADGGVMSADVTPAQRWAAWFRALAAHLTRYPHLAAPYSVTDGVVGLWTDSGAALLAWADTLMSPALTVQAIKGEAFVHVTDTATVGTLDVWCVVPGFPTDMQDVSRRPVDLDVLRRFVAEGACG